MCVIIKGMVVPDNCMECMMRSGSECIVAPVWLKDAHVKVFSNEKPGWCPLTGIDEDTDAGVIANEEMEKVLEEYIQLLEKTISIQEDMIECQRENTRNIRAWDALREGIVKCHHNGGDEKTLNEILKVLSVIYQKYLDV